MKVSAKVAIGGAVAALSLVLMLLTAIPAGIFALPAFSGILLVVVVIEIGYGYAFSVYFVTSVLSFLLLPNKEAALLYTIFFGFYPIVKSLIERLKNVPLQYIIKFALFNICMVGEFFIAVKLMGIPEDSYELFGVNLPLIFLLLGNVFFIFYDLCITRLVAVYFTKWRSKINKNTKL